jgi:phage tail sheath gpL-like
VSIEFQQIPANVSIPGTYVELDTRLRNRGLPSTDYKLLLVGQMTSDGDAAATTPVQLSGGEAEAILRFGQGSVLHRMAAAALAASPYFAELWAVPLEDDGSAVAATGSFAIAVTTATAGTLRAWIGGDLIEVAVSAGDSNTDIAALLEAAIGAAPDLPVTSSISTSTVTVTAKNGGTLGNGIDLAADFDGTGVTITVTAMSSGANDPDTQDALDGLGEGLWDVYVPSITTTGELAKVQTYLDDASDGINQRPGVACLAVDDTISNLATLAAARNSGRISILGLEGSPTWMPEVSAAYGALMASASHPGRPLNGLPLEGVASPPISDRYLRSELAVLLRAGIAPGVVTHAGDVVVLRAISTYLTSDVGVEDAALLDVTTIRSLDYVRRVVRERLDETYRRMLFADVATTEFTASPATIRATVYAALLDLEEAAVIQDVEANAAALVVERNGSDTSRVDIDLPAEIVPGLHVLAAVVRLLSV